jgi:L-malate glycosyltransferase
MRILFAASARSPNTHSFVEGLVRLGHDAHIATLHPGDMPTGRVHVLGTAERGLSRVGFVRAIPAFRRLHRRIRPDVTIGYYASSYGLLAATVSGPRVVATAGGDVFEEAQDSAIRRFAIPLLARLALTRADLVLCWAPHLAEAVERIGIPSSKILTLPRGIDTTVFAPGPALATPGVLRIISTRSLDAFYRPEMLVDALAILRADGVDATLELVGDGPAREELAARVGGLSLTPYVVFLGRVPPSLLAEALRRASVYVAVPPSDGVSASLLEAMACGLVPVVSDIPANRTWIEHGANGLLVEEPPTPRTIASALARALEDGDLARRSKERNLAIVAERASRERNSRRFELALTELVDRARSA